MPLLSVNGNLQLLAPGAPFNAVFVRLVSDLDGSTYVSAAASDAAGNFTVAGVPMGPGYQIQTGPSSSGPFTGQSQNFTPGQAEHGSFVVNLTPAAPATNADMTRARVSALNTLALTFFNATAAANVPIAGNYLVTIVRT